MLQQSRPEPKPGIGLIDRELSEQQAGDGIWRLAGSDGSWQDGRYDSGGCKPVIADNPALIMHDDNGCKTFLLITQGSVFQPTVEKRLATGE